MTQDKIDSLSSGEIAAQVGRINEIMQQINAAFADREWDDNADAGVAAGTFEVTEAIAGALDLPTPRKLDSQKLATLLTELNAIIQTLNEAISADSPTALYLKAVSNFEVIATQLLQYTDGTKPADMNNFDRLNYQYSAMLSIMELLKFSLQAGNYSAEVGINLLELHEYHQKLDSLRADCVNFVTSKISSLASTNGTVATQEIIAKYSQLLEAHDEMRPLVPEGSSARLYYLLQRHSDAQELLDWQDSLDRIQNPQDGTDIRIGQTQAAREITDSLLAEFANCIRSAQLN